MDNHSESFDFCKNFLINEIINRFDFEKVSILSEKNTVPKISFIETEIVKNTPPLKQIKVFEQQHGALCGFHCLFNLVTLTKFFKSNSEERKAYYASKINNVSRFWIFYRRVKLFLLNNLNLDEKMRNLLKNMGALERYQFQYCLEKHGKIKKIVQSNSAADIKIFRLFYGFSLVQSMSRVEIVELQRALDNLKNEIPKKKKVVFILLGITNHWALLTIVKEAYSNQLQIYFSDSININYFTLTEEEAVEEFVEERNRMKIKYGKIPFNSFFRQMFKQLIYDMNSVMRIIYQILYGNLTLFDLLVTHSVERVLETYEEVMNVSIQKTLLSSENIKCLVQKRKELILWLKSEYHPKVLSDEVVKMVEQFNYLPNLKKKDYYNKLLNWVSLNKKLLSAISRQKTFSVEYDEKMNERLLVRFGNFLDELINLLGV